MPRRLQSLASALAKVNGQIKHDLQDAEAKVSDANALIGELARSGMLRRAVLLGKFREASLDPDSGDSEPAHIIQAALLIPEGIGVCAWDSHEAYKPDQDPEHFDREVRKRFVPFGDLDETDQVFILPQLESLVEQLMAIAEATPALRHEMSPR